MLILYHCDSSYASQKVRLYLEEKDIPYQGVHIDLRKQEHITSDYRKINPQGTVPSLRNGDLIICGSTAIMEYLEKEYGKNEPLNKDHSIKNRIHEFCITHEKLHDPHIRLLSYYYLFFSTEKLEKTDIDRLLKIAKNHPSLQRGEFLKNILQRKITTTEIDAAKSAIAHEIERMNHIVSESHNHYLFGDHYTMADAVCTATLFRIEKLSFKNEIEKYPLLLKYYGFMKGRENFKRANMI